MVGLEKISIAVDFGGTKVLIGAITSAGEILSTSLYKTGYRRQQDAAQAVLRYIDSFIREKTWGENEIAAVGIGLVGQIDFQRGMWCTMYGEEGDSPIPFAGMISKKYGVPCAMDNDVKAALAAECAYGRGRNCGNFAYVNVGTGIAAGFVCDGRVVRGHRNNAGEIGHYVVDLSSDVVCCCGSRGCVEAIASGAGLFKRCRILADEHPRSEMARLVKEDRLDIPGLYALADAGDAMAKQITQDAADALTVLIGNVICSYSPEAIVFGGGLFNDEWMFNKIQGTLPQSIIQSGVAIRRTGLAPRTIGIKGAAVIGFAAAKQEEIV